MFLQNKTTETSITHRDMITLPGINQKASITYHRLIPTPNGDCKIVTYPGDQYFPDYNLTMNGLPDAITCGLTAALNVSGTALPVDGDTNGKAPTVVSNGSESTNGENGAFVAPPPQAPFKTLDPKDYTCIAAGRDSPFCLPPGSYASQSGLGFEISRIDTLTLPPGGWSLTTTFKDAPVQHQRTQFTSHRYVEAQRPEVIETSFQGDMKGIGMNRDGVASFTIAGPTDGPDPVCCLFTQPRFGGNVWCVGVGGGDLLPQWKDQPQSVSCHNGGWVWLYAKEYGDAGAALIRNNIEDLKIVPYGAEKDTISKKIKAIWVKAGD